MFRHAMSLRCLTTLLSLLFLSFAVHAHEYQVGDLRIAHPWARPTVAGQLSGGAYLSIANQGKIADKLLSAASPAAKSVEIHSMSMAANVMTMREVGAIEIKPSEKIAMQPGHGYHIMLMGLNQMLRIGDKIPLTLRFEKAGKLEVSLLVEDKNANQETTMPHMPH